MKICLLVLGLVFAILGLVGCGPSPQNLATSQTSIASTVIAQITATAAPLAKQTAIAATVIAQITGDAPTLAPVLIATPAPLPSPAVASNPIRLSPKPATGSMPKLDIPVGWKSYRDVAQKFAFRYPETWTLSQGGNSQVGFVLSPVSWVQMAVLVGQLPGMEQALLDQFVDQFVNDPRGPFKDYELVLLARDQWPGQVPGSYVKSKIVSRLANITGEFLVVISPIGDKGYALIIMSVGLSRIGEDELDTLDQVISSVQIE